MKEKAVLNRDNNNEVLLKLVPYFQNKFSAHTVIFF